MKNKYTTDSDIKAKSLIDVVKESYENTRKKEVLERNVSKYKKAKSYSKIYPVISICSGYFVGCTIGHYLSIGETWESFNWWSNVLFLGVVFAFFAIIAEEAKRSNKIIFAVLGFCVSIGITVSGGYVGSMLLNDQSEIIASKYDIQNDSLSSDLKAQIAILDLVISENKINMNSGSKWTRYHAQKDLIEAQKQKTEIQKLGIGQKDKLSLSKDNETKLADKALQYKGFIYSFIFVILEILLMYSYHFQIAFNHKIRVYNDMTLNIPVDDFDFAGYLREGFLKLNQSKQQQQYQLGLNTQNQIIPNTEPQKSVGFQFGVKQPKKETDLFSDKYDYTGGGNPEFDAINPTCQNCGEKFEKTHPRKKYCSDACRQNNWKTKNRK